MDQVSGKPQFGMEGYNIPKAGMAPSVKSFVTHKTKIPNYLESILKTRSYVPSPVAYDTCPDWGILKNKSAGKFANRPRETIPTEIARLERKSPSPSPTAYDNFQKVKKIRGIYGEKQQRVSFIEEAQFRG